MAVAYTGQKANNNVASGTSLSITVPVGGFTAGNKLILVFMVPDASAFASSATDSASNTYTVRHQYTGNGRSITLIEGNLTTGLTSGQTATATIPDGGLLMGYEFSGLQTGTSFDVQEENAAVTSTFTSTGTATTAQADELLFGTVNTQGATVAPDAPWVELDEISVFASINETAYQIVSSAGSYAYTGTLSIGNGYASTIDTFKSAAAAAEKQSFYTSRRRSVRR